MGEFTPITSQEQFDEMVKDRLNRQNAQHTKELEQLKSQYADYADVKNGYDALKAQVNDLTTQLNSANEGITAKDLALAEKDAQIKTYALQAVKQQVAAEMSLPFNAIDFISGSDEDSIRKSAEQLKGLVGARQVAPLADYDRVPTDTQSNALRKLAQNINH